MFTSCAYSGVLSCRARRPRPPQALVTYCVLRRDMVLHQAEPQVVRKPLFSMLSLTTSGTPSSDAQANRPQARSMASATSAAADVVPDRIHNRFSRAIRSRGPGDRHAETSPARYQPRDFRSVSGRKVRHCFTSVSKKSQAVTGRAATAPPGQNSIVDQNTSGL